jgi:hypothetical protein
MDSDQAEVIQALFDAFKTLTEENIKKERRISRIELQMKQLRELISQHLVDGLELIKRKVQHVDRVDTVSTDIEKLKTSIEDIKYAIGGHPVPSKPNHVSDRSPSPNRFRLAAASPLPFPVVSEAQPLGLKSMNNQSSDKLMQIQTSLEQVLNGIEYIARQRNTDVESINSSLENLDRRMKILASGGDNGGTSEPQNKNVSIIKNDIKSIKDQVIPELEADWANKWAVLSSKLEVLSDQVREGNDELESFKEKCTIRDSKLSLLMSSGALSGIRSQPGGDHQQQLGGRILKLESDTSLFMEEIRRLEESMNQLSIIESRVELNKSECRSNWERVARQNKQDIDALRVKIDRIAIIRDEFERINSNVKNLEEVVNTKRFEEIRVAARRIVPDAIPPLVQATNTAGSLVESPSLSFSDDVIGSPTDGMVVKQNPIPVIPVPVDGSEMGTLRFDSSTSRLVWTLEHVDAIMREPNRFSKILLSPEFSIFSNNTNLIGRMKLFPSGSDQSRIEGNSSFYLRCLPGVTVQYSIDIAGEVLDAFECQYEKQRDKGKHDFVKLNEYVEPDGSLSIGLEIKSIAPN